MLFLIVFTEGEVSEPECLRALLGSQMPHGGGTFVEVVPVPVGGNHGHMKLVEISEQKIHQVESDKNSTLSIAEPDDLKEKWLVCDFDDMDKAGVDFNEFKEMVTKAGYKLVINKPNFEYFVLLLLAGEEVANKTNPDNYIGKINEYTILLNEKNKNEKGFSDAFKLPPYTKKKYEARDYFNKLMHYNPELLFNLKEEVDETAPSYTQMPKLINALKAAYGLI